MNVRKLLTVITLAAICNCVSAEEQCCPQPESSQSSVNVAMDTRIDFDWKNPQGEKHSANFYGKYLNLIVSGNITPDLKFFFRQRLNKFKDIDDGNVFGATDILTLDYTVNGKWTTSLGKQVVAIGGFEYDANPINLYFASMFWNNVACYQFGISESYRFNPNHSVLFQFCNSPYTPTNRIAGSMFSYNLMWNGRMGCYSTIWSINEVEYRKGRFGTFIALGNRLDFKPAYFEFDLMSRYTGHQSFFFGDYSVIGKLGCSFGNQFDVFVKGGYEKYRPVAGEKYTVQKPFYGGGVEVRPLRKYHDLRFHLAAFVTNNTEGRHTTTISAGAMWYIDIFKKKWVK